jgi:hypothetical protein
MVATIFPSASQFETGCAAEFGAEDYGYIVE